MEFGLKGTSRVCRELEFELNNTTMTTTTTTTTTRTIGV